ncbi:MAG: galactokinase [Azospirillaceae bacterium]
MTVPPPTAPPTPAAGPAPFAPDAAEERQAASGTFLAAFGRLPEVVAAAHSRANLLGEHTDYNDGFVLPTPLVPATAVAIGPAGGAPGAVRIHAAAFGETVERPLDGAPRGAWSDYVIGCLRVLADAGHTVPALDIAVASSVPMGAGVSSSAALEVAVLRAVREALGLDLDDRRVAMLGRAAENGYVGMPCGIMDQMVAALGAPGRALFLDARSLETRLVDLPDAVAVSVVHCGVAHRLTAGDYATRKAECERAAEALGVASLRDLGEDDIDRAMALPEPLGRRVRHVVTENARVLDGLAALESGDAARFGRLMVASHASQRDDYAVSIPEIDALVDSALGHGAIGARLTGGGFGGSIVALVERGRLADWRAAVLADNPEARPVEAAAPGRTTEAQSPS